MQRSCGTFYKYLEKCVQHFTILLQPVREAYLYFYIYISSVVAALFVCSPLRADILTQEAAEEVPGTLKLSSPEGRIHSSV